MALIMHYNSPKSPARRAVPIDGMLPVYKPKGMTSRRVSTAITRKFGKMKIGHAGTLDPMAQGVLPILMGKATKLQDYIQTVTKSYRFCMELGSETDTLDAEGEVMATADVPALTEASIEAAVSGFRGDIEQVPPLYSAVKFKGKALYSYARSGSDAEIPLEELKRTVSVHDLTLLKWSQTETHVETRAEKRAEIWLDCVCSKGTYIRCLARDIAKALGTVATVTYLERTSAAGIPMTEAVPLESVIADDFSLSDHILPLDRIPVALPRLSVLESAAQRRLTQGQKVPVAAGSQEWAVGDKTMLLSAEGSVFGVGEVRFNRGDELVIAMIRGL